MTPAGIRPRRSVLFVPGSNPRAIDKVRSVPADVLVFDLEDAVAPEGKDEARAAVVAALAGTPYGTRELVVRVNGLETPWVARDIAALAAAPPHAIIIPKVNWTDDIRRARAALSAAGTADLDLWAMIETPAAVLNAAAISAQAEAGLPRLTCLVVGTNDLAAALEARIRPGRAALAPHLAQVLLAARAYGLAVIDGTFNDIRDERGFRNESRAARDMGFDGKTLIHPGQVATANTVFAPSADDVVWARQVVTAFGLPENAGKAVLSVSGRMVERLHLATAQRTLAMADAITAVGRPAAGG